MQPPRRPRQPTMRPRTSPSSRLLEFPRPCSLDDSTGRHCFSGSLPSTCSSVRTAPAQRAHPGVHHRPAGDPPNTRPPGLAQFAAMDRSRTAATAAVVADVEFGFLTRAWVLPVSVHHRRTNAPVRLHDDSVLRFPPILYAGPHFTTLLRPLTPSGYFHPKSKRSIIRPTPSVLYLVHHARCPGRDANAIAVSARAAHGSSRRRGSDTGIRSQDDRWPSRRCAPWRRSALHG